MKSVYVYICKTNIKNLLTDKTKIYSDKFIKYKKKTKHK